MCFQHDHTLHLDYRNQIFIFQVVFIGPLKVHCPCGSLIECPELCMNSEYSIKPAVSKLETTVTQDKRNQHLLFAKELSFPTTNFLQTVLQPPYMLGNLDMVAAGVT